MLHIRVGLVQGSDPQRCQSLCQREREKWRVLHWQVDALVCKWHAPLSLKTHWPEWVMRPLSSYSGVRMSDQPSAQEGRSWRFSRRCGLQLTRKLDLGSCRLLTPSLGFSMCIPLDSLYQELLKDTVLRQWGAAETIWVVCVTEPSYSLYINFKTLGFPGGSVVKNLPTNAGDTGSIPGLGRSHIP